MLTIGLTGGIGSGKTSAANLFAKRGITIIDADIIAREVIEPDQAAYMDIIDHFEQSLLQSDGYINRRTLRDIIFTHPEERIWLEELLHPIILKEIHSRTQNQQGSYCIAVIPLLLETGPHPFIDRILLVDCPEELQIKRAAERDQSHEDAIAAVLDTQMSREERQKLADDIITNDDDIEHLDAQVDKLHTMYLQLAGK